jgi:hypothetical protein
MDGCNHGQGQASQMRLLRRIRVQSGSTSYPMRMPSTKLSMDQARKLVPAYSASNTLPSTYLIATSNSTLSSPPNPTQHKSLYAFCLTSSKIPKYVPTPPKKKNGSRTVSGYVAPKLPALRLRQQRMPRYPLDLLAPLRLRLLRERLYASGRAHACR